MGAENYAEDISYLPSNEEAQGRFFIFLVHKTPVQLR